MLIEWYQDQNSKHPGVVKQTDSYPFARDFNTKYPQQRQPGRSKNYSYELETFTSSYEL
jgi:hypothetical protein